MKILVTGGAGFIGSHLVDAYCAGGHTVCIIDNLSTGSRAYLNPRATLYEADICHPEIAAIFARERPDVVNHHAAQIDVRRSTADPLFDCQVNVVGFLNVMECARKNGCRRVVLASSGGTVYGEQEAFPATEGHPTRPCSPYGIAKLTAEHYLHYYERQYGIPSVSLRYANVYGPRQNAEGEAGVVAIFARKMLAGERPMIYGDGTQTRDFTYIDDVVAVNQLALRPAVTGVYNVGTGVETAVNALFQMMKELSGADCTVLYGPAKPGEQRRSALLSVRLQATVHWQPTVALPEGLRSTVEWFRNKGGRGSR